MTNDKFKRYRVDKIVDESEIIKSFYLLNEEGQRLVSFLAGQFLTFKLRLPGETESIVRNYSLSCPPDDPQYYRISVKREPAPLDAADVPAGLISNYLHNSIKVGDVLTASLPGGQFHLNPVSNRPVVLLCGGVGVTPMISMLHKLHETGSRRVVYIHACENERVQAFKHEAQCLAEKTTKISLHHVYRNHEGQAANVSGGVVNRELLQRLLYLDDYEFYLCGPPAFMSIMYQMIRELGISAERIAYEYFGPACELEKEYRQLTQIDKVVTDPQKEKPSDSADISSSPSVNVHFKQSDLTVDWNDQYESILECAETNGLTPDFSCRAGICSTCHCGLSEGEVDYIEEPLEMPEQGYLLPCISKPKSNIVIEL